MTNHREDGEFGEGATVRPVSMVERVARAIYEADDVWSDFRLCMV